MKNTIIILGIFTLISCGKTGTKKSYYADGKLKSVEHFIADKLHDTCLYYYEDGKMQAEVICNSGNLIKYTEYQLDGSLDIEFYTHPSNEDYLIYKSYNKNGYLRTEINFRSRIGGLGKGTSYKYDYESYQLEEIVDFTFELSPSLMIEFRPSKAAYENTFKILERSNKRIFYEMYNLKPEIFSQDGTILDQSNIKDFIIMEYHEKPRDYYPYSERGNSTYYYESGKISKEKYMMKVDLLMLQNTMRMVKLILSILLKTVDIFHFMKKMEKKKKQDFIVIGINGRNMVNGRVMILMAI